MSNNIENAERYSPEKLLLGFSRTKFIAFTLIALLVHVVFIGATSINYIYYKLNPDAARAIEEKKAAAEAQKAAEKKLAQSSATTGQVSQATSAPTAAASSSGPMATAAAAPAGPNIPESRMNAPVVKEITATAKPDEIPKSPGDLGIRIEDTNPK